MVISTAGLTSRLPAIAALAALAVMCSFGLTQVSASAAILKSADCTMPEKFTGTIAVESTYDYSSVYNRSPEPNWTLDVDGYSYVALTGDYSSWSTAYFGFGGTKTGNGSRKTVLDVDGVISEDDKWSSISAASVTGYMYWDGFLQKCMLNVSGYANADEDAKNRKDVATFNFNTVYDGETMNGSCISSPSVYREDCHSATPYASKVYPIQNTSKSETYDSTVSWSLSPVGIPTPTASPTPTTTQEPSPTPSESSSQTINIDEINLTTQKWPEGNSWVPLGATSLVEGNTLGIEVKGVNSGPARNGMFRVRESVSGRLISEEQVSVRSGDFEFFVGWNNTDGLAWQSGRPRIDRTIEARIEPFPVEGVNITGNTQVQSLMVIPRPIVLAHGLWSDWTTFKPYEQFLPATHPNMMPMMVGDGKIPVGAMDTGKLPSGNDKLSLLKEVNSLPTNAWILGRYIAGVQAMFNAEQVDVIGHSMGGLITRYYISEYMDRRAVKPSIRQLIMLGTPNGGSPCADVTNGALGIPATYALRQDVMAQFNKDITNLRGVKASILSTISVPMTCHKYAPGDVVVPRPSAYALPYVTDRYDFTPKDGFTGGLHTSMTGSQAMYKEYVEPRLINGPSYRTSASAPRIQAQSVPGTGKDEPQILEVEAVNGKFSESFKVAAGEKPAVSFVGLGSIELVDPTGKVVARGESMKAFPMGGISSDVSKAGTWNVRGTADGAMRFAITLGNPKALMQLDAEGQKGKAKVTAWAKRNGKPVDFKSATVEFKDSAGEVVASAKMNDQGRAGDAKRRDDKWTALTTLKAGTYSVVVTADFDGTKDKTDRMAVGLVVVK